MRRKLAMLLCLLLLIQLSLIPAYGAERVYFTAVGNNVLPLSDSTMPFWSSGYVYVASSVFTGAGRESLGISQVVNNEKNRVVLYSGGRSLTFDLARYTATDNDGQVYYPGAVRRNGTIFVPAYAVTRCFDLTYSVIEVRRGSLVWIRQSSYTLSDSYYADAAEYSMESVYADYLRAREQMEPPPERPAPPTGTGSGTSGTNGGTGSAAVPPAPQPKPAPEPEPEEEETLELHGQKIYLCIAAGGDTSGLLDALDAYQAQGAFFFSPEQMEASGNLLRRMSAKGKSIGILADGGGRSRSVARQLEDGNRVLSKATCGKTRLAMVTGGGRNAPEGYRTVQAEISGMNLESRSASEKLLHQIASRRGDVTVWLSDNVTAEGLRAFLAAAREAGGVCAALRELS